MGNGKLNSPHSGKIGNPLKNTDKSKLKAHHAKNLEQIGIKQPKSPLG